MNRVYEIKYKDGTSYGKLYLTNKSQKEVEIRISEEIKENNKNVNEDYHLTPDNFHRIQ